MSIETFSSDGTGPPLWFWFRRLAMGNVEASYGYEMVKTRDELTIGLLPPAGAPPVEWLVSDDLVDYDRALTAMTGRAEAIARGEAPELVWLLEHAPLYTAGTSSRPQELLDARFPVHTAGRGGQFTYHGPGQRVGYVMLDLKRRAPDVRRFVASIEEWIIRTLTAFNVRGERRDDRVGVWVSAAATRRPNGFEDKIAAIGIRVRQWVTLHGFAINVEPDLTHFSGIVPCGVSDRALRRDLARRSRRHAFDAGGRHGAARGVRTAVRRRRATAQAAAEHREQFVAPAQRHFMRHRPRADRHSRRAPPAGLGGTPRSFGHGLFGADEDRFD